MITATNLCPLGYTALALTEIVKNRIYIYPCIYTMILHRYRFLCQIIWASGAVSIPFALSSAFYTLCKFDRLDSVAVQAYRIGLQFDYFAVYRFDRTVFDHTDNATDRLVLVGYDCARLASCDKRAVILVGSVRKNLACGSESDFSSPRSSSLLRRGES